MGQSIRPSVQQYSPSPMAFSTASLSPPRAKGSRADAFLIAAVIAAFVLLAMSLASCRLTETIPLQEGERERVNIRGRVKSKPDVISLFGGGPIGGALVLAIPSDKVDPLLEEVGLPKGVLTLPEAPELPVLSADHLRKYVEASAISQRNGKYALWVPPGKYLLCLANLGRSEMVPAYVGGCIEVTVLEGKQLRQDIFWGEAGVSFD